jgi:DNA sulfur modification protein DndC
LIKLDDPLLIAIDRAAAALENRASAKWIIGFSGGKDSTATLKIILSAMKMARKTPKTIEVVYCDTGVENPILDRYVKETISKMEIESEHDALPIKCRILKSPLHDRFFVKIIGRGYPPPTNNFRWCTNGLRIRPVSNYIKMHDPNDTVLALGIRLSESIQRDRVIGRQKDRYWQKQTEGQKSYDIFAPIVDLNVEQVWDAVFALSKPRSISPSTLERLYRDASGECPIIKSPLAPPCASGRFGCWTCTVVRKDKSSRQLISAGHTDLVPYLKFRDWLAEIRNDPARRWPTRRSGNEGMGPFTIETRMEILDRVNVLEDQVRCEILDSDERGTITALWRLDHVPRLSSPPSRSYLK